MSDSPTVPLIELRGLTKTYGMGDAAFQALKGIDLTIQRREFVAIMGASGSGKSTLMNVLGCLDTPTEGTYRYEGIAVQDLDTNERSLLRRYALGFVFQGFNLLPRTSSLDNVELPLLYRGVSRKERREKAVAALTSVGLPTKLDSTPAELSGGQQQRVAIARAIVTEPSTLFADEPTGNLDSVTTGDVMELLKRLNEERGITVLVVTHDDHVATYARRIVVIKDGLIESDVSHSQGGA
jgi:putative ABC transport system ATP-binding protein